ncbi:MAG: AbrB/MazE/SpoVT family DNA-binding domain-containing protein [Verrucomicrobia bacterium]|nr:AbrB/MazE/SpoVT family DNA-binding domain-containing protein [Verrucomicrobiota bacterium]
MTTTTVSSKGQIVLPARLRQEDGIRPGQEFEVERVEPGAYLLRRRTRRNEGLVALLRDCPVKDWFQPLDRSDTTDDIPAPKLT